MAVGNYSLEPEIGRQLPPKGPRNHPWSAFEAYYLDQAGTGPASFAQGGKFTTMLFLQDAPCFLEYQAHFPISASTVNQWDFPFYSAEGIEGSPPLGMFTPDETDLDPYQEFIGTTVTNGVRVRGYVDVSGLPMFGIERWRYFPPPPRLVLANANMRVRVFTQAPVLYGPMSLGEMSPDQFDQSTHITTQAIILHETMYTQAIQDAGDVYIYTAFGGADDTRAQVVGIYRQGQE
jgi:hypothetical protein